MQAYGETYDASIIEREFPWKKCSSFRTRALILPPGQIFCQTTGEKSGTVVVGKRKKEEKRISSNNHAMTNKVWKELPLEGNTICERIPESSPFFFFEKNPLDDSPRLIRPSFSSFHQKSALSARVHAADLPINQIRY